MLQYDRRSGKDGDDPGDLLSMSLSIDRGCMASILINRLQVGDFSRVCRPYADLTIQTQSV